MEIKDIDNVISELESKSDELKDKENLLWLKRNYNGPDEVVPADVLYKALKRDKPQFSVISNIKGLDVITGGFRPGNLIIISGPTKQGKTTFCQTLTYNFWQQKYESLWFSFDTPPQELIERFPKGRMPKFYLPRTNIIGKKIRWIEAKIIEGIAKYGIRIVFIDHLESLALFSNNAPNYSAELQSIVKELKEISMRWNVVILLNHHIRQIHDNEAPNWTQLKNSSGPAQESDMTIMVWRNRIKTSLPGEIVYEDTANISVQLNRRTGKTGTIKVDFKDNLFYESGGIQRKANSF